MSESRHLASSARILAGDIGATHSRLAVFAHQAGSCVLLSSSTYSSPQHGGLSDVLAAFLEHDGGQFDAACLGLPAPIRSCDEFSLTNLPWRVDPAQVHRTLGTDRVRLINDVEACAAGISGLSDDDLDCLQAGEPDPNGNRVVVSVGTGLGVSALTPAGQTFATEAGHATFTPSTDIDHRLKAKLQDQHGHVSWERVASGPALPSIYSLLAPAGTPPTSTAEIVGRIDSDPICARAVDTFRRYVGAATGDFALTLMARGGIYLAGGVSPRIFDTDNSESFLAAFVAKGRMRSLLERMPVYVVREDNLALRGAAQTAATLLDRTGKARGYQSHLV